jgi:transcriptional regulator with PAS, ATPase and Fis domain
MAQGMSRALDDFVSQDGSRVAAGAATVCQPHRARVGTAAPGRPRWDVLGRAEANIEKLDRHAASWRTTLDERSGFDAIIGRSPNFIAAIDAGRKVAATATTVLVTGESGTGKEVLARAIHQGSARADRPFVALNCAALPETLVESELFGHERGAFTGADRLKRGTLFLDEIGELTPAVQAKLLRVLQERQYERVGGTTTVDADIRLIAATNQDLERAVAEGRFRQDLYYRVAVFRIHLPTLRERGDDVVLLADHFVRDLGAAMERPNSRFSGEARRRLLEHSWPGNVRELQNAVERALILAEDGVISAEHLGIIRRPLPDATIPAVTAPPTDDRTAMLTIAAQEKRMIVEVLQRTHGHQKRAAALLGLTRFQLYSRLKRYHIEVSRGLDPEQGWTAIRC